VYVATRPKPVRNRFVGFYIGTESLTWPGICGTIAEAFIGVFPFRYFVGALPFTPVVQPIELTMLYRRHRSLSLIVLLSLSAVGFATNNVHPPPARGPIPWAPYMPPYVYPYRANAEPAKAPERREKQAEKTRYQVTISDNRFEPEELSVATGDSVTWHNHDDRRHSVTADYELFGSGEMQPGDRYTHTFSDPGVYRYYGRFTPSLRGVVEVK
jgi:plastocyanin